MIENGSNFFMGYEHMYLSISVSWLESFVSGYSLAQERSHDVFSSKVLLLLTANFIRILLLLKFMLTTSPLLSLIKLVNVRTMKSHCIIYH